jgi:hypothetical protein
MPMPAATITPWEPHPKRADIFRAVLFGALGVVYAVLLFPLALGVAILWAVGKVIDATSSTTDQ